MFLEVLAVGRRKHHDVDPYDHGHFFWASVVASWRAKPLRKTWTINQFPSDNGLILLNKIGPPLRNRQEVLATFLVCWVVDCLAVQFLGASFLKNQTRGSCFQWLFGRLQSWTLKLPRNMGDHPYIWGGVKPFWGGIVRARAVG